MTQNLALGDSNSTNSQRTLTSANTNIDNGTTYYLPPPGKQGSSTIDQSSTLTATTTANFYTSNDNRAKTLYKAKNSDANSSDTVYYNFYTATLGFSYYKDSKTVGYSTRDICPKGWRLPWGGGGTTTASARNEFLVLAKSYNPNATWTGTETADNYTTDDTTIHTGTHTGIATASNKYAGFAYTGYADETGTTPSNIGFNGRYWTSSVYNTEYSYGLSFKAAEYYPNQSAYKYNGRAIRCIAKEKNTMQDFDASTSLPNVGNSTELIDLRDRQTYTVKRLPDGKVWMMQNLTIGMDGAKALTSADTNVTTTSTYYLPAPGKQGGSTITTASTATSTTTANFGTSNDGRAKTRFRTKDSSITNDSDTGYYNLYTATLGYSNYATSGSGAGKTYGSSTRDICPKGWRLPKTPNTKTQAVSSAGSDNDFTYLAQAYNSSATWTNANTAASYYTADSTIFTSMLTGSATTSNRYAGFSYAGYWNSTNSAASDVGTVGRYWTSSVYNVKQGYSLYFTSPNVYSQNNANKYFGYAVRCVTE